MDSIEIGLNKCEENNVYSKTYVLIIYIND